MNSRSFCLIAGICSLSLLTSCAIGSKFAAKNADVAVRSALKSADDAARAAGRSADDAVRAAGRSADDALKDSAKEAAESKLRFLPKEDIDKICSKSSAFYVGFLSEVNSDVYAKTKENFFADSPLKDPGKKIVDEAAKEVLTKFCETLL